MKKWLAEFIGTFALVFAGTGAVIINDVSGGTVTHVGVALTFGLIVMAMIYSIGEVSGAHINPAVSFGFWVAGRLSWRELGPYILSQAAGGLLASLLWRFIFPAHSTLGATIPALDHSKVFVLEAMLTFLLMFVIIRVSTGAKEKGLMAGVAVGGVVGLEALFSGPVTGASMNPVRSLAPALVSGNLSGLWIYLTAPFLGAVAAVYASFLFTEGEGGVDFVVDQESGVRIQETE